MGHRPEARSRCVAPLHCRPAAHRSALPRPLRGVGELGQQRRAGDVRARRPIARGLRRARGVSPPAVAADAAALVGPVGAHRAPRIRRRDRRAFREHRVGRAAAAAEPVDSGDGARLLVPADDGRSRGAAQRLRADRHRDLSDGGAAARRRGSGRAVARRAARDLDRRRSAHRGGAPLRRRQLSLRRQQQLRRIGVLGARVGVPMRRRGDTYFCVEDQ